MKHTNRHLLSIASVISATIILFFSAACSGGNNRLPESESLLPGRELARLNDAIASAPRYQKQKDERFDSLKKALHQPSSPIKRWHTAFEIAETYRQVNADSSLHYASIALQLAPPDSSSMKTRAHLAVANALSTAGLFIPAKQTIDSIRHTAMSKEEKTEFWKSARMLYSYMSSYVQDHSIYAEKYRRQYIECDDSLLRYLPENDMFHRFIFCERLVSEGKISNAKSTLENLMSKLPAESNLYGMAAFQLAEVYKSKGDFKGYAKNLALAAECDIKGCIKEGIALPTLANWLYEHGDFDNAFNYINFALENANSGNIRMRTVSIASLMPVIDEAYSSKLDSSKKHIMAYLIVTFALLLAVVTLLVGIIRGYRRIHANEKKLALSSKKLETYVGNFISLCSSYASRLDQLSKLVIRKISAGQSDDLLKLINSGKFTEDNDEEFYQLIDKALLDIFPDFVDSINTLLKPDKQIRISKDDPLTPELRIYAFVRLGVEQSAKIAQILNYSVNTVYSYRNRMRNRAIDHDNFDANVANLGRQGSTPDGQAPTQSK